jgi:hypothetical protein
MARSRWATGRAALLRGLLVLAGAACPPSASAQPPRAPADPTGVDFFEKKVRPLLAARCYGCHGAAAAKVRGGLRLDSREAILAGGNSGPAVVPGDPNRSLLIKAVRHSLPDLRMPPKKRLSPDEVADLSAWVKRGAPAPPAGARHGGPAPPDKQWAFLPPKEPPLPRAKQDGWARGPIDRFLLARLEAKGLRPAPPAEKRALLRRATYDLTGLPPTPEETDAFLRDDSPDAFARVVSRLLSSPAYGERWGRHWLDLVRYTDDFTEAWRYRDWVVAAFNRDLPYDQFIAHQVAGDRLPAGPRGGINAEGVVATTMLSIGQWGGIDPRKRLADVVDDQIDTVSRTFLGLTVGCARCHDHKFDPVSQEDYYGLAGIFYSSRVFADTAYLSHQGPLLKVPLVPPADVEKHRRHAAQVRALEKKLQDETEREYEAFARGLLPQAGRYLLAARDYRERPADQAGLSAGQFASRLGLRPFALEQWVEYLAGKPLADFPLLPVAVRDYDGEPGVHAWRARAERPWWGVNTNKHEVAIETFVLPPRTVSVYPSVDGGAVAWKSPVSGRVRVTGRLTDADPHDGAGVSWAVDHAAGGVRHELSSGTLPPGSSLGLDQGRHPGRLASVEVRAGDTLSLQVWLSQGDAHYDVTTVLFTITRLDGPGEWDLTRDVLDNLLEGNPHRDSQGKPAVWSFHDLAGSGRKARMPAADRALAACLEAVGAKPDRPAWERAARLFQTMIDLAGADSPLGHDLAGVRSPFWVRRRDDKYLPPDAQVALAKRAAELGDLRRATPPLPCAHAAQDGGVRFGAFPGTGDVRVHLRGDPRRLGPRVPRRFPRALAAQPPRIASGSGRPELARWLGSAGNPLTARVMVNRIWQHHFGEGLVRTPSNFGRQGSPPSHPELLDWLALRFVESGWSVKEMHRLIMLSAAYQQSSHADPEGLRADPENLLFGRMNRRRLEAEALRDGLLAVCGRLDRRGGGPADRDDRSRRRMLYLATARSDRAGFRTLFDGADASIHVEKRAASTVAPQALYLMNAPLVLGAVQHLARRPEVSRGTPEHRVRALYRVVLGRPPAAGEVAVGLRLIEGLAAGAPPAGDGGPLGPWEAYAQALLLSNEFLFVD